MRAAFLAKTVTELLLQSTVVEPYPLTAPTLGMHDASDVTCGREHRCP